MGRTNPTYRDFLEEYERSFGDYRRALRRRYQEDFDRLFARARSVADAAGYANHVDRDQLVAVSMLLAHETALRERETAIEDLESEIEDVRAEVRELRGRVGESNDGAADAGETVTGSGTKNDDGDGTED